MTGIWLGGAFLASAAFGWQMAALVCILVAAIWVMRRSRRAAGTALLVCLAAIGGALRGVPPPTVPTPPWIDSAAAIRGEIVSPPTSTGRSQSFQLAVTDVERDGAWHGAAGVLCVSSNPLPPAGLGDKVVLVGSLEALSDQAASSRAYFRNRGCGASLFSRSLTIEQHGSGWQRGFADLRMRLSGVLRRAAPGDAGALLSGLVTGDDHTLTAERQRVFLRTGTTHITAVSGSNVALVVAILTTVGVAGGIRRRLGWQLAVVGAIAAYAILVGGEPPVVRAAIVAAAAMVAVRVGRRPDFVTLIALAATVMVMIEPAQIWSLSFQLSFAASLGIVLAMSGLEQTGHLAGLTATVRATLAAQIATLPVLWFVMGQLSLTTLPANLLIAPLIGLAFPLAALAGAVGLAWEPLAVAVALPARFCVDLVFAVVDRLGGSDWAMATVGESSPLEALLVSALAVTAIGLLSPDARRWLGRLRQSAMAPTTPTLPGTGGPEIKTMAAGQPAVVERE